METKDYNVEKADVIHQQFVSFEFSVASSNTLLLLLISMFYILSKGPFGVLSGTVFVI